MITALAIVLLSCFAGFFASGCGGGETIYTPSTPSHYRGDNQNQGSEITGQQPLGSGTIIDRTGKIWDVAHARKYGLEPSGYQYGLGPFAIRPLMNPEMLSPEDPGYPGDFATFMVLGTTLNGFTRAYPTWTVLSSFEIANEKFGDAHVAVAF